MATVQLNASGIGGTIFTQNSGPVTVPANGLITVDTRDVATFFGRRRLLRQFAHWLVHYCRRACRLCRANRLVGGSG